MEYLPCERRIDVTNMKVSHDDFSLNLIFASNVLTAS
jgi:hypothetical protein